MSPQKQAFVTDPDGYYIEFCACQPLEDYLGDAMSRNKEETMSFSRILAFEKFGKTMREKALESKKNLEKMRACGKKVFIVQFQSNQNPWFEPTDIPFQQSYINPGPCEFSCLN